MAVSTIKFATERLRQEKTGDDKFFTNPVYFFELRVPAELSAPGSTSQNYLFPLAVAPESYSMSEPFTVEITPSQGGGVYAEENGILVRTIKLSGTTGFKPRPLPKTVVPGNAVLKPEKASFSRALPGFVIDKISGQRHFQYLQDAVFRTYADLKRDPATSEETRLFFHNPKDDEHWLVIPNRFDLTRNSGDRGRVLYNYDIEMTAIDKADASDEDFSEDKGLLDSIKDAISTVKKAADLIEGAINDITAIVAEVATLIKSVGEILDKVTQILDAVKNFIDGVTQLIEAPFAILESAQSLIEGSLEVRASAEALGQTVKSFPDTARNKFRQLQDGLDLLGTQPQAFEPPSVAQMREIRDRQDLRTAVSRETLEAARAGTAPTTLAAMDAAGTQILPGEAQSSAATPEAGRGVFNYTSTRSVSIGQGDTLVNMAARLLGDARLWQHIAVVNGLKPPFIAEDASKDLLSDDSPFPGTLGIGDKILIPSFSKAPQQRPLLAVLGVVNEAPAEEHLLGTDISIVRVGGREGAPLYDVEVDTNRGASDTVMQRGVDCLVQGIFIRATVEQGTDILYKRLGVQRMIGLNNTKLDKQTAKFRFIQAMTVDTRVAAVRSFVFEAATDGALVIDTEVEIRGLSQSSNIKTTL